MESRIKRGVDEGADHISPAFSIPTASPVAMGSTFKTASMNRCNTSVHRSRRCGGA